MTLVDTSAWIEWLIGSPTGERVAPLLPQPDQWLVPSTVRLELAKWVARELDEDRTDRVLAFLETCVSVPLDDTLALSAAELCGSLKLATADAVIYATARADGAELVTCDAHFEGLPGVRYVAKTSSVR